MKLIFAIIRYDNEDEVVNALTQKRFSITKLSSTGGFLRKGNTTLMIGTEEERVKEAIETIKKECGARQKITINMPYISGSAMMPANQDSSTRFICKCLCRIDVKSFVKFLKFSKAV